MKGEGNGADGEAGGMQSRRMQRRLLWLDIDETTLRMRGLSQDVDRKYCHSCYDI
jgi:hypothetical protein